PLGADVAAEAGDQQVLAASRQVEEAVAVEAAQIATGDAPLAPAGALPDVAEKGVAGDDDFALLHADIEVGQGPARGAGAVVPGNVEAHHRGAFRQAVALVHRQSQGPGAEDLPGGHPAAPHGDKGKAPRWSPAGLGG